MAANIHPKTEAYQTKSFLLLNWYIERSKIRVKKRPRLKTIPLVVEIQEDYQGYRTKLFCLIIQFAIKEVILFSPSEIHWDRQQRNNVFQTVRYVYHILASHFYMSDIWFGFGLPQRNRCMVSKYCLLKKKEIIQSCDESADKIGRIFWLLKLSS